VATNRICDHTHNSLFSPDWSQKETMKKNITIKIRMTIPEKRRLDYKATSAGLTRSEFIRRCIDHRVIKERLTEEEINTLNLLKTDNLRWQKIGNMFGKRDPRLRDEIVALKDEFKSILLENFR